jgi:hypothetical protein
VLEFIAAVELACVRIGGHEQITAVAPALTVSVSLLVDMEPEHGSDGLQLLMESNTETVLSCTWIGGAPPMSVIVTITGSTGAPGEGGQAVLVYV